MDGKYAGQTVAGCQQFTVGPPPPPPQLSYVDQSIPHFTEIPQMFQLYYQGEYGLWKPILVHYYWSAHT